MACVALVSAVTLRVASPATVTQDTKLMISLKYALVSRVVDSKIQGYILAILFINLLFLLDIDECAETRGLCRGGRCINTPGSFRCECGPGMELSPDRLSCKDVDECSITSGKIIFHINKKLMLAFVRLFIHIFNGTGNDLTNLLFYQVFAVTVLVKILWAHTSVCATKVMRSLQSNPIVRT